MRAIPVLLSRTDIDAFSKLKKKSVEQSAKRYDRSRELRRAVTPFSFSALQENLLFFENRAELKKGIVKFREMWYNNLIDKSEVVEVVL